MKFSFRIRNVFSLYSYFYPLNYKNTKKRFFSHEKESFSNFILLIILYKEMKKLKDYHLRALITTSAASAINLLS